MAKSLRSPVETVSAPELPERRYVYNGSPLQQNSDTIPLRNKPVKRRKQSPLNIIFIIFSISVIIVFYVWNKITVNRLAIELNDLQNQHQKIVSANEILRAGINKKSSLERIERIAIGQLGLTYPKEQPVWFDFTDESLDRIQQ